MKEVKSYTESCLNNSNQELRDMCKVVGTTGYIRLNKRDLARSCCVPLLIREDIDKNEDKQEVRDKALHAISKLVMSGGDWACTDITPEQKDFLQYTVEGRALRLYRGISLVRRNVNPRHRKIVDDLREGDVLPNFLYKSSLYDNCYASFSKKKSIANWYARDGLGIVVEGDIDPQYILVDLENLHKIAPDSDWVKTNKDYFKSDKEVIVIEPVQDLTIVKKRER